MRTLAAQADDLLRALDDASVRLLDQVKSSDERSLIEFERALDALLVDYRTLLTEIAPPDPKTAIRGEYEPFLRSMVAFATIVGLIAPRIGASVGIEWGQHVFSDSDFKHMGFDKLGVDLPHDAVLRILPDQAADLRNAVAETSRWATIANNRAKARITKTLEDLAVELNCPDALHASLGMELEDANWVKKELNIDDATLESMTENREIISVPSWSGKRMYPTFQIHRAAIIKTVVLVCRNAADSFKDWPLAIWMAKNHDAPVAFFEEKLGQIGLWKPLWTAPVSGQFRGIKIPFLPSVVIAGPLFRVSRNSNSPFYFSSASTTKPDDGGRFDPHDTTHMGALYTAERPFGAWSETLDRQPVVSLRELVMRTMWTLTPKKPFDVAGLATHSVALASTMKRSDTQLLATDILNSGCAGLNVGLRSRQSELGVVVFGNAGPNLPATAGIGLWSATPGLGIEDPELWKYIEERERMDDTFPVVLRRFPTEMRFGKPAA